MEADFGSVIKSIREESGLSVRELAKLAKINHTDVSKLEHNKIIKPSIGMLLSLSKVLQTNLLALYLDGAESFLFYKTLIDCSVGLTRDQLQDVVTYINDVKRKAQILKMYRRGYII